MGGRSSPRRDDRLTLLTTSSKKMLGWVEAARGKAGVRLGPSEDGRRVAVYEWEPLRVSVERVEGDRCVGAVEVDVGDLVRGRRGEERVLEVALRFVPADAPPRRGDLVRLSSFAEPVFARFATAVVADESVREMPVVEWDEHVSTLHGPATWPCRARVHRNNLVVLRRAKTRRRDEASSFSGLRSCLFGSLPALVVDGDTLLLRKNLRNVLDFVLLRSPSFFFSAAAATGSSENNGRLLSSSSSAPAAAVVSERTSSKPLLPPRRGVPSSSSSSSHRQRQKKKIRHHDF